MNWNLCTCHVLRKSKDCKNSYTDKEDEADKLWLLRLLPNFKGMPLDKKNHIKYEVQGLFIEMDNLPPT